MKHEKTRLYTFKWEKDFSAVISFLARDMAEAMEKLEGFVKDADGWTDTP